MAAREEQILDEHLLNIGRRSTLARTAYLFMHLFTRAQQVGLAKGDAIDLPLTQQHLADTLGMSLVHMNKTLKRLAALKSFRWKGRLLETLDREALARTAGYDVSEKYARPFL